MCFNKNASCYIFKFFIKNCSDLFLNFNILELTVSYDIAASILSLNLASSISEAEQSLFSRPNSLNKEPTLFALLFDAIVKNFGSR